MRHVLAAAALLCCASAPDARAQRNVRDRDYEMRVDTTYAFDRRGTVVLTLRGGEIIVTAWNRDEIRVRARSERMPVRFEATPSRLSLELARPSSGEARFEVTVPVGVRVIARSTQGDISVTGTRGAVELSTQSGDVIAEDVAERADLVSLSGDISVRGVAGTVDVRTTGGDVVLADVKGDVDATSISGDLILRNVTARFVRARSTSGDVSYDGDVDASGRYDLGSHSGDVILAIPAGAAAQVTVATYTGAIDSDFPITLRPGEHAVGAARRFTFDIGKGDARISAESFSGDVTIRQKARRPQD